MRVCLPFILLIAMSACREERTTIVPDGGVQSDGDTAQCAALPFCAEGETAVSNESECPQDTSCRPVTLCGSTIWCWSGAGTCAGPNPGGCTRNDSYDSCEEGFRCDLSQPRPSGCSCNPEQGTWECTPDLSGGTCVPEAQCAAYPSCADGETEVSSEAECPQDTSCRAVSICGSTIWCWRGVTCEGTNPGGCTNDDSCDEGFRCDFSQSRPSACGCDPENGSWICTADLSGGTCVPEARCSEEPPHGCEG